MTSTIRHTVVFAAVFMLAPLAIDMYLPALPSMARDLNTGIDQVEATVAILLFGYALGQLVLGPLSDRFGRLQVLQAGLVVFAVSSLAAGIAQSIGQLYVIRLFQAFGGAASVVVFPMVRDRYDEEQSGKVISYIMAGVVVAPLVAPLIGAWIMAAAGWPSIFFALGAMGVLALGAVRIVLQPAGSSAARRAAFSLGGVLAGYSRVLGDRRTMAHVLAGALGFAGLFAFVAGSPFVYMTYFGVSPQHYGWLVGLNATAMIAANVINAQVIAKMDPSVKMAIGAALLAAAGLALVLASAAGLGLPWIVAGVVAYVGALGLTSTNSIVGALSSMPEEAGTVSALIGAAQFAIGSISSLAISLMASTSATTMTLVMAVCGIGSLLAAFGFFAVPVNFRKEQTMLEMQNVDHVGIRISDREKSVAFYEMLGFEMIADGGYDQGHPLVMLHPSGININLLGPATARAGENVLMDEDAKYPGITHLAIKMVSAEDTEAFAVAQGIEITGRRSFRGTDTIFIRDPDRNVLELVGPGPSVATLIADQVSEMKS